jgi:serralysin
LGASGDSNWLFGGSGNDWLGATGNNNYLDGGTGNDTLTAGVGPDVFRYGVGYGRDVITNFDTASGDVIDLRGLGLANLADVLNRATQVGNDVVITINGSDILTLRNVTLGNLLIDDFLLA